MKLSARNALKGKIEKITKGAVTTTVHIDVGHGIHLTSSITNDAAEDLDLKVGDTVTAIVKSSDVIVGK
ncbi:MAG: TOBE domain-containing protein [Nevskiales bacterium]|nr:TOBE domain-containing protein [Nevskiales bacterium]